MASSLPGNAGAHTRAAHRSAGGGCGAALARQLIDELAAGIPDPALRENFLTQTLALYPPTRSTSARRAEKKKFGGLIVAN